MFSDILRDLWGTTKNVIPLMAILIIFQLFVLKKPIENVKVFVRLYIDVLDSMSF